MISRVKIIKHFTRPEKFQPCKHWGELRNALRVGIETSEELQVTLAFFSGYCVMCVVSVIWDFCSRELIWRCAPPSQKLRHAQDVVGEEADWSPSFQMPDFFDAGFFSRSLTADDDSFHTWIVKGFLYGRFLLWCEWCGVSQRLVHFKRIQLRQSLFGSTDTDDLCCGFYCVDNHC